MPRSKEKQRLYEQEMKRKELEKKTRAKLRKQLFAAHVMNKESDTFMNYTKAAQQVHPNVTKGSAKNAGSEYMQSPYVLSEIERICESEGLTLVNRVRFLREIIAGECERETVQHVRNAETGEWMPMQKQVSKPSFKERLDALKELNILDGTREKSKTIVTERNKFFAEMRKSLMKQLDNELSRRPKKELEHLSDSSEKTPSRQSSEELDAFLTGDDMGKSTD